MKFFKTTGLLWVIVGLVVAYAYIYEYEGKKEQALQTEESKRIVSMEFQGLKRFHIKSSQGDVIVEKKSGDNSNRTWQVTSPFQDEADSAALESIFQLIAAEKYEEVVVEGPDLNKAIYGLDDPWIVELKSDTQTVSIRIGRVAGLSGKKYLMVNEEPRILLGSPNWDSILNKSGNDFRKKDILNLTEQQIETIEVKNFKTQKTMIFKNQQTVWAIQDFPTLDLDSGEVQKYIASLVSLRANQFVDSKSHPAKKYLEFVFTTADQPAVTMTVFEPQANVSHVQISSRSFAMKISSAVAATLLKTMDDFRDRRSPLKFNRDTLQALQIRSEFGFLDLEKKGTIWSSKDPKQIDSAQVERFLNKLGNIKVKSFLGKNILFQESGASQIRLFDSEGEVLNLKWSPRALNNLFVTKSSSSEEYLGLAIADVQELPFSSLLKPSEAPTPTIQNPKMPVPEISNSNKKTPEAEKSSP